MPKVRYKQKFRKQWLEHPSLKRWIGECQGDDSKAYCKYCKCELSPKLHDLIAHSSTAKHKAFDSISCKNQELPFKKVTLDQQEQEATLALFVTMHSAIAPVDHLSESCKVMFKDANNIRLHRTKCTGIIKNVLAPYFEKELELDVGNQKFSLLIDESTDIAITKLLGLAIIYFSKKEQKIVSTFFAIVEIERGDAMGIYCAIKEVLQRKKLKITNLIGIGTDNAAVMVGSSNSVSTLLKNDVPNLVVMKCVCHSIQLAVSHSCKAFMPEKLEFLIYETYNWFSKSSLRQLCYKNIYNAINDDKNPLKITRSCDTRWLSIETAVTRIIEQWVELRTHFGIAALEEKCHKAQLLSNIYKDDVALAHLLFLRPILLEMQKVNKTFQIKECDPTKLLDSFSSAFAVLQDKILSPDDDVDIINTDYHPLIKRNCYLGYQFETHVSNLKCNGKISESEEEELRKLSADFVVKLIDELKMRLPENYRILKKVNLFSSDAILRANKEDITCLLEHFKILPKCIDEIIMQYKQIHLITWKNTTNTSKFWSEVQSYRDAAGNPTFDKLTKFALEILSLPWSNAEVERVFSQVNLVKTKLRNRMQLPLLSSVLHIRYGLKMANKCCKDFKFPKKVLEDIGSLKTYKENEENSDDINILSINLDD